MGGGAYPMAHRRLLPGAVRSSGHRQGEGYQARDRHSRYLQAVLKGSGTDMITEWRQVC